jgi:hypothetical protein
MAGRPLMRVGSHGTETYVSGNTAAMSRPNPSASVHENQWKKPPRFSQDTWYSVPGSRTAAGLTT